MTEVNGVKRETWERRGQKVTLERRVMLDPLLLESRVSLASQGVEVKRVSQDFQDCLDSPGLRVNLDSLGLKVSLGFQACQELREREENKDCLARVNVVRQVQQDTRESRGNQEHQAQKVQREILETKVM